MLNSRKEKLDLVHKEDNGMLTFCRAYNHYNFFAIAVEEKADLTVTLLANTQKAKVSLRKVLAV